MIKELKEKLDWKELQAAEEEKDLLVGLEGQEQKEKGYDVFV